MTSAWSDLQRPPLSEQRLRRALAGGPVWREIRVVAQTRSTNADVAAAARAGEPEGLVVVAEAQDAGRGRLERRWESPPRAGVLLSALLRPQVAATALPLLPLLVGVAAVEAVRTVGQLPAELKWPNDVLVGDRKLGGILVERADGAVVVGIGLNVSTRRDELPVDAATSLALEGGATDREPLVKELLRSIARRYVTFCADGGAAATVVPAYREVCATVGRDVRVLLPDGGDHRGRAVRVDDTGRLVVHGDDGADHAWSAGDVLHVRSGEER